MSSGFVERTASEMSTSHIFPQGVLAAIPLVGGGATARARCDLGLLLCSVANITLLGVESGSQVAGAEALSVGFELVLF